MSFRLRVRTEKSTAVCHDESKSGLTTLAGTEISRGLMQLDKFRAEGTLPSKQTLQKVQASANSTAKHGDAMLLRKLANHTR